MIEIDISIGNMLSLILLKFSFHSPISISPVPRFLGPYPHFPLPTYQFFGLAPPPVTDWPPLLFSLYSSLPLVFISPTGDQSTLPSSPLSIPQLRWMTNPPSLVLPLFPLGPRFSSPPLETNQPPLPFSWFPSSRAPPSPPASLGYFPITTIRLSSSLHCIPS